MSKTLNATKISVMTGYNLTPLHCPATQSLLPYPLKPKYY